VRDKSGGVLLQIQAFANLRPKLLLKQGAEKHQAMLNTESK
jgi:hypothetical protein